MEVIFQMPNISPSVNTAWTRPGRLNTPTLKTEKEKRSQSALPSSHPFHQTFDEKLASWGTEIHADEAPPQHQRRGGPGGVLVLEVRGQVSNFSR